ncbi:hypothetical protein [Hyphomicrobium sp.]|uniref:hypothetical protein n=1 Tax=Hyphomicrobium sp. TaxID=82 RepID=UPI003F71D9C1
MIRHLRRVTRRLLPYRHELTALAKQFGCDDEPFRCWLENERLKNRAAKADKYKRDAVAVRASFQTEVRKAAAGTIDGLRAAKEALETRESKDADARVWLMTELESGKARLERETAATRAYQSAIIDLLAISRGLRARIVELELVHGVPASAIEASDAPV